MSPTMALKTTSPHEEKKALTSKLAENVTGTRNVGCATSCAARHCTDSRSGVTPVVPLNLAVGFLQ